MDMERSDQNSQDVKGGKNSRQSENMRSEMTLCTASIIATQRRRGPKRTATKFTVHDNTSPGYGWLLPGWLAEERQMDSGRIYRVIQIYISIYTYSLI